MVSREWHSGRAETAVRAEDDKAQGGHEVVS